MRKLILLLALLAPSLGFVGPYTLNGSLNVNGNLVAQGKGVFLDSLRTNGDITSGGSCFVIYGKGLFGDSVRVDKGIQVGPYTNATLPTRGNGSIVYCTDCGGAGTGAVMLRVNGAWTSVTGSGTDTTGIAVRGGHEPGQTIFGRDRGYAAGKGLDLRGFIDAGTQDTTANLTLDMDSPGQGTFNGTEFDIIAKTQSKGWKAALSIANNSAAVTHDGSYTLQPIATGNVFRILMTTGSNSQIPVEVQAKSGSTAAQTAWENSSGTKVAYVDSIWGIKATRVIAYDSLRTNTGLYVGGQLVNKILRSSATLDFDLTAVTCQDLTITVTGANVGDEVALGIPNGSVTSGVDFEAWVSSASTVTVRACTFIAVQNPASGTFKVTVIQ